MIPELYKATVEDLDASIRCAGAEGGRPNAVHTRGDFCRGLANAALYNRNAAAAADIERSRDGALSGVDPGRARRGRPPSGEWFRKKLSAATPEEAVESFEAHLDLVVARLAKEGNLSKKLDVCIDKTFTLRHDSKPGPELVRGAIRGNRKAYAEGYIVMQSIVAGERLTLAWAPVGSGDSNHDKIRSLFDACARRGLRIGTADLDREFYDTRAIKELERYADRYIIPCPANGNALAAIKEYVAGTRDRVSPHRIERDRDTFVDCTIIMAEKKKIDKKKDREPEDKIIAFCTNDPDIDVEEYARRWGGETANRQFKSARIRTRTTKQGGRMLCFAATLIMFNVWVLINAILDSESRMRTRCAPPPCPLGSVLGILVDAFGVFPTGPGPPPPAPPPARAGPAAR